MLQEKGNPPHPPGFLAEKLSHELLPFAGTTCVFVRIRCLQRLGGWTHALADRFLCPADAQASYFYSAARSGSPFRREKGTYNLLRTLVSEDVFLRTDIV